MQCVPVNRAEMLSKESTVEIPGKNTILMNEAL
jgi:hypothetical protein